MAIILAVAIWWIQGLLYEKQLADKDSEISYLKSRLENGISDISLSPQQEKLLMLVDKYQVKFGARKLIIEVGGAIYLDDPGHTYTNTNIADELLGGIDSPERARKLETIMDGMPSEYLRRFPS